MAQYFVNRNKQANGDHEVHTSSCIYLPAPQNRLDLGYHTTCVGPMTTKRHPIFTERQTRPCFLYRSGSWGWFSFEQQRQAGGYARVIPSGLASVGGALAVAYQPDVLHRLSFPGSRCLDCAMLAWQQVG